MKRREGEEMRIGRLIRQIETEGYEVRREPRETTIAWDMNTNKESTQKVAKDHLCMENNAVCWDVEGCREPSPYWERSDRCSTCIGPRRITTVRRTTTNRGSAQKAAGGTTIARRAASHVGLRRVAEDHCRFGEAQRGARCVEGRGRSPLHGGRQRAEGGALRVAGDHHCTEDAFA